MGRWWVRQAGQAKQWQPQAGADARRCVLALRHVRVHATVLCYACSINERHLLVVVLPPDKLDRPSNGSREQEQMRGDAC